MAEQRNDDLRESRRDLGERLEELAGKVVGTGHPDAPGVTVEVREPAQMHELTGAHPITRSYDTVAEITVHDDDPAKAKKFAGAIGEALETDWAQREIGACHVSAGSKPNVIEARYALSD